MSSREQFEAWVMTEICISKSTLEGLRTEDGYRNSTLSGTDYNRMWNCWQAASKASEQQLAAVVAENAGLKAENDQALQCMAEFRINLSMYKKFKYQSDVKTPATDSYLAEARAQGVEMLLASLPVHYTARADIEAFAASLRQGAAL